MKKIRKSLSTTKANELADAPKVSAPQPSTPTTDGASVPTPASDPEGPVTEIPIDQIDLSPNYRKWYDPVALKEFAAGIAALGFIISPVTLRLQEGGRYQLVVGFRRYLGAQLAKLTHLPAIVRELTDEQVEEIQLQENIQREDPHPMHEAEAIVRFYDRGIKTDDIALRLGKSVSWVYLRVKLARLLPALQEMFVAGVFSTVQAYEIAELSPEAQGAFFDKYCAKWKEQKPIFKALSTVLASFRCDLMQAAFDIRDPQLVPAVGACMTCPFNTAFGGFLLPDPDAVGKCTRTTCFENKTRCHYERKITDDLVREEPVALITDGEIPEVYRQVLAGISGAEALPLCQVEQVTLIEEPEMPSIEDYQYEYYPEEDMAPEDFCNIDAAGQPLPNSETTRVDQVAFAAAMALYEEEQAGYAAAIAGPRAMKGYFITAQEIGVVYYYPEPASRRQQPVQTPTNRPIKALIAAHQDTVEDLQQAIAVVKKKAVRSRELDREKVQKNVHDDLQKVSLTKDTVFVLTEEDKIASRWVVIDAVTQYVRKDVLDTLHITLDGKSKHEAIYAAIRNMSDADFAFLVRMTIIGKADSKLPNSMAGFFLRKVAESAGVDVAGIEATQDKRAKMREENDEVKIGLYKLRIKKHQGKRAA